MIHRRRLFASDLRQSGPSQLSLEDEEEAVRGGVRLFRLGLTSVPGVVLEFRTIQRIADLAQDMEEEEFEEEELEDDSSLEL